MPKTLLALLLILPLWTHAHSANWDLCAHLLKGAGIRAGLPNPKQRKMAMGLELLKIKPRDAGNLRVMVVEDEIKELSRANLAHLLAEIPEPPSIRLSPEQKASLREMVQGLSFLAVHPITDETNGPIEPSSDFYANLVGGSKTVGLKVVATAMPDRVSSLQGLLISDHARAKEDFIREYGLVLPAFGTAVQVWNFFNQWHPEILQEIVTINRYNIPARVKTPQEFAQYLSAPYVANEVFPGHSLSVRLAPAKENLHRFVLTVSDAEIFYRHALMVYMQLQIEVGLKSPAEFERVWLQPGGAGSLLQSALEAYGWPEGAQVRVPLNLPSYSILRYSEIRAKDPRLEFRKDSRRLDHTQMP